MLHRQPIFDELAKSRKIDFSVIPAPHQGRDKLQPVSSKINNLKSIWTPVFTGVTTFCETIRILSLTETSPSVQPPEQDACTQNGPAPQMGFHGHRNTRVPLNLPQDIVQPPVERE